MPARIILTDEQISAALEKTEGLIAAAARLLGICSKTLSRRLAEAPELRIKPAIDPLWQQALAGDAAVRSGGDLGMSGDHPFIRYVNIMDWSENEIEDEPTLLTPDELKQLFSLVLACDLSVVTPRPRRRKPRASNATGND